ncbi:hypothetical protein RFC57_005161, partial [Klebsiella pneumoniae]|nr:hypothetical protein [Klebsiella pneumoniae]
MTLQAVNELIATLESAGELSIREQKFLKLAREFKRLAAENVGMRETIEAVRGVADNSSGIAGWHLNDEIAKWSEILPEIDDIETPATDRIVAQAEARGVEKFAAEQRGVAERLQKRNVAVAERSISFCLDSAEEAEV